MSDVSFSPGTTRRSTPRAGGPRRSRRPRGRSRRLRLLAFALIAAGALALIDAAVTLVWQEPVTALIAKLRQDNLKGVLRKEEHAAPTAAEQRTLASLGDERRRIAFLAGELSRHTAEGGPLGRIVIPHIGISYVVVKGTGTDDLKSGPGLYPQTTVPGLSRTTAIAGHRTTYLAPFRHIDSLVKGDEILLQMPYAHFTYTVTSLAVVAPTDVPPPRTTSATRAWCCPPARRCSAPTNGCWCSPA